MTDQGVSTTATPNDNKESNKQVNYIWNEPTDDGKIAAYPDDKPFQMREQGLYNPDELCLVLVRDARDMLIEEVALTEQRLTALRAELEKAEQLVSDADAFDLESEPEGAQWFLEAAEQFHFVRIDQDGDAGTSMVSVSQYWEMLDDEDDA